MEKPLAVSYEELRSMPAVEQLTTLTCISNRVGGDLISNARWKGVRLRHLLEQAGVQKATAKVAFSAADGYSDSIPWETAQRDDVLVAYEMNGEPLTREHGFPARLVVPGLYGVKSVKWLANIQPEGAEFQGYWQQRGWSDTAVVRTMSRLDVPESGQRAPLGAVSLGGVAFAGVRGISAVEVSADSGATWHRATVGERLGTATWVLWTGGWTPPAPGTYVIQVRAVDGLEDVQTADVTDSYPDGATGHHKITVTFTQGERG